MKTELSYVDIFPKVIPEGKTVKMTVKPLGRHVPLTAGKNYTVTVSPLNFRNYPSGMLKSKVRELDVAADADGCLRFDISFEGEQEHFVIFTDDKGHRWRMSVYSVAADLAGRYPFMGDLHVHTCVSDGREAPAIVCANYRKMGFDFTVISDHHRYFGSQEAIAAYKDAPIDLTIVPGEEVHLPGNPVHVVNFGGLYSVNALVESTRKTYEETDIPMPEGQPDAISDEEFKKQALAAAGKDLPEDVDPLAYGASVWEFDAIRKAGGLAIFPHPYWIEGDAYNVSPALTDYLFDTHPFDAFELLGGERYFAQNGFQDLAWQESRARGNRFPIVGSTDSHGSVNNPGMKTAKTIVFSPKNERAAIIDSVKGFYSVAVDTISEEVRLSGELRMAMYGNFLLENYFPLHDELCFEEGRLMKDYVCGEDTEGAKALLGRLHGRTQAMLEKYFAF